MARRDRSKAGDIGGLLMVGSVVYLLYGPVLPTFTWIMLAVAVILLRVRFFMPTYCDYQTQRGTSCTRWLRGKLRGRKAHARLKRDAVWQVIRLHNPGLLFRVKWRSTADPPTPPRWSRQPVAAVPPTEQGARNATILICTVLSTVTGVVSAAVGVIALYL